MATKRRASAKQRDAARETAKRLISEGRFGGSYGRSFVKNTSRKKYSLVVPRAKFLLPYLEWAGERRSVHSDDLLALLDRSMVANRVDRDEVLLHVVRAYNAALSHGLLAPRVYVSRDGVTEEVFPGKRRTRPEQPGERKLELWRGELPDFATWSTEELLQALAHLSATIAYPTEASREARGFVLALVHDTRTAILDVLDEATRGPQSEGTDELIDPLSAPIEGAQETTGEHRDGSV